MAENIATVDGPSTGSDRGQRYKCPFCEATYPDEVLARVHVSRSEDGAHRNRNGFMPETGIELVDERGKAIEVIEGRKRPDRETDPLDLSVFPDEFDRAKRHVLGIAAEEPNASYTEIHERAGAVLAEHDLEPVSYGTVRRWVKAFYRPQLAGRDAEGSDEGGSEGDVEALGDLTPKQQAVVIAHLDDPGASIRELADRAGCSTAYPSKVLDTAGPTVRRLTDRLESGESLEGVLRRDLTESERERLARDDLLGERFFDEVGANGAASSDVQDDTATDGPVNSPAASIMSATPEDGAPTYEPGETEASGDGGASPGSADREESSNPEGETPGERRPSEPGIEAVTAPAEGSGNPADAEAVPRTDVEALRERVRLLRRIAEREYDADPDDRRAGIQLALASEFERELNGLLED